MQPFPDTASEDEIVLQYERQLIAGNTNTAKNIRYAHSDLIRRFDAVDERLARK